MVYKTFQETVRQSLQTQLGDRYQIFIYPIPKNNGTTLDGLSIQHPDIPMSPTIYLNPYYEQYLEGMSLEEIKEDIFALFLSSSAPDCITPDQMYRFDLLREKIMFKLIHTASNQTLLQDLPHILHLDLAIVFYLFLERNETGQMTAMVHNEHLALWNITETDLLDLALINTQIAFPAILKSMSDVMREMAKETLGDDYNEELMEQFVGNEELAYPLYVLTNQTGLHGAGCILYPDLLKNFADTLGKDLVILPSSIHEVLLTPHHLEVSYEDLSNMVTSINQNEVPTEDQLSNQVYLYSQSTDHIQIVTAADGLVGHSRIPT